MSVLFLPPPAGAASIPDASETVKGKIRIATSAEATAGTDDLTSMTPLKVKSVVDAAVVGGVTYQGTFDASSPADLSNASKGDLYIISVAGSYQGQDWAVGDHLLINADMGGTLDPNKIDKVDNTDAVTSVAGRTGAVVLSTADISGLATVATSGAYSDLSGTPSLATVATTGAYSDLSGTPTLGTAAAEDVGTSAGNVVQLNGSAQLPAVDGSLLTNISATVAALNDVGDVTITTPANTQVIKYNSTSGDWENGAVAYADVSGTPSLATVATTGAYSDLSGTPSLATVATTGAYSDLSGLPTLGTAAALDVGTSATNVVQLNGSAQLPAVDGSLLTNISATVAALNDVGDVTITTPTNTQVIKYNSTSGDWENGAVAYADVSGTPSLATVATTGAYSDLSGLPTLGTAAALDVGTSANNVVQLDGSARLPAVDGSQLINLPSGAATLGALSDVDTTGQAAGDLLKYDGTNWVAVPRFEVVTTVTSSTALTVPEMEQLVRTSGSGITLTLPNIASNSIPAGVRYQVKVTDSNSITIAPNGGEFLEGVNASYATSGAKEALTVLCDGTGWWFV